MTWRVQLWTGVYRSDLLGVKISRSDVRRPRTIAWDGADDAGAPVPAGSVIVRVAVDGDAEAQIVQLTR